MVYKQSSAPYCRSESPFEDGVGQWTIQALLHISITLCVPYALHMQPYAVRMHFFDSSKKPMKSSAERTSKKPYALYAPLLGVGVFLPLFLLRELHTVHTATYGFSLNRALALLPVVIEALPASKIKSAYGGAYGFLAKKPLSAPYRETAGGIVGRRIAPASARTHGARVFRTRKKKAIMAQGRGQARRRAIRQEGRPGLER